MSDKTALVVIDMQEDYLRENRKKIFTYDTDALVTSVNRAIAVYRERGCDVLYVKQVFQNIITNRVFIGFTIKGTPGAEIFSKVDVVSDHVFEKYFSDSFSAKAFREHVAATGYSKLVLCGLDECGCVGATAKGAVKAGLRVTMLTDCIGRRFPDRKVQKMRKKLQSLGVKYVSGIPNS